MSSNQEEDQVSTISPAPASAPAPNMGPAVDPNITLETGDRLHVIKDCARIVPGKNLKVAATRALKAAAQGEGETAKSAVEFLSNMRLSATLGKAKVNHGMGLLIDGNVLLPDHLNFYEFEGDSGGLAFGFCSYASGEKDKTKVKYDKLYMQFLSNDVRLLLCNHDGFQEKMDALAQEDAGRAEEIWAFLRSEDTRNDGKFLLASQIQRFMVATPFSKVPTSVLPRKPPTQASLDRAKATRAKNRALKEAAAGGTVATLGGNMGAMVASPGGGVIPAAAWAAGADGSAPKTAILIGAAYDDHNAMVARDAVAKKDAETTAMLLDVKDAKIKSLEKQLNRMRGSSRAREDEEASASDDEPTAPKVPKKSAPAKKKARKE